eukprot:scaffold6532_cov116-Isochrysis_galbana.AAC.3
MSFRSPAWVAMGKRGCRRAGSFNDRFISPLKKQLRARVEGSSRWRPSSFGWSPLRWFWPRTKVLRVPASTAPKRAHHRYDFAPARRPVARPEPEPAQRTAISPAST